MHLHSTSIDAFAQYDPEWSYGHSDNSFMDNSTGVSIYTSISNIPTTSNANEKYESFNYHLLPRMPIHYIPT